MASRGSAGIAALFPAGLAAEEDPPSSYVLPVAFGELQVRTWRACLLLDMPARTLIRRLCRTKHTVRSFAVPAAAALIVVRWGRDWHQMAHAGRRTKAVPQGSLTLSALDVTLTNCDAYTDDLVVGRVPECFAGCLIGKGDSVGLRSFQPNDCSLDSSRYDLS